MDSGTLEPQIGELIIAVNNDAADENIRERQDVGTKISGRRVSGTNSAGRRDSENCFGRNFRSRI